MLAVDHRDSLIAELRQLVATQQQLIASQAARITELALEVKTLRYQLDEQRRHRFGQRSEKDLSDGDSIEADAVTDETAGIEFEDIAYRRRKRKHRRERLSASLPRVDVYYDISEGEKTCACGCGRKLRQMRTVISEVLVIIPEVIYVRRHIRPVYGGCAYDSQIIEAPMLPLPIKKGLASPELIAAIAINKYVDHLPLYRQQQRFARYDIDLSRQTMCDWLAAGAQILSPLVDLIEQKTLNNPIIHTDDTPMPVLAPGTKKTKTGRLWVYAGRGGDKHKGQHDYVFYAYSPDRKALWPQTTLLDYAGYIQADAYPGYDPLFRQDNGDEKQTIRANDLPPLTGKATEVACWMHARREFYRIAKHNKKQGLAYQAVQMIKPLYAIEKQAKYLTVVERYQLRQTQAKPRLDTFKTWLDESLRRVMPKTPIHAAIGYALNQWTALCRYVDDGRLAIDNGYAERLVKSPCIGKKNFLFFGSDTGGINSSHYYTLIQSAQCYQINPQHYLADVIRRLKAGLYHQLDDLLPHRWQPFNPLDDKGKTSHDPIILAQLIEAIPDPPTDE